MKKKSQSSTEINEDEKVNGQTTEDNVADDAQIQAQESEVDNSGDDAPEIAEYQAKIDELHDRFLRQAAEFDNYRKRTIKEKADIIKYASADIITAILPIIDDMERAVENSKKVDDINIIKEGMELILNKLMRTLESKGLKRISPKGDLFDTDYHEAIALVPATDEKSKGKVLDCARDGYLLDDKVLRHAQVAVAQ